MKDDKGYILLIYFTGIFSILLVWYLDNDNQSKKDKLIETQKQTIEHLNFIISRHDTTHSKCFKIK